MHKNTQITRAYPPANGSEKVALIAYKACYFGIYPPTKPQLNFLIIRKLQRFLHGSKCLNHGVHCLNHDTSPVPLQGRRERL